MLSTLLLNRAKTTSKLYCALLVTLSLFNQVKKYKFWPSAAPAQTASSYIPEPPPELRGRPLKLSKFYKVYRWPFVNYYDNEKKISTAISEPDFAPG